MTIFYVSTTGSDLNNGLSSLHPKFTISSAITAAASGDTIQISEGTYTGNININKHVILQGADKATTIIQPNISTTTATIQITDGSSGTTIKNLTVKGKFLIQTTTGSGDANNNNSAFLVLNTNTSTNPPINNVTLENLIIKNASNGVAFNNKHSNNITIKNCVIENNEGSGIRVASNVETMNELLIDGCTVQNNNLNAITSNPSGNYRPNCTNFKLWNCFIKNNNKLTLNNSHDVSLFGFNGDIEISNTSIECNHYESKSTNGSASTSGGWGLVINGTGSSNSTYQPSGNIAINNVTMTGNVIKSVLGFDRYSTLGTITLNNLNIKDCQANKSNQTWLQLSIGHRDTNKSFSLGNTRLRTIYTTNIGNVDATQAEFYDINTGSLLTTLYDLFQITTQIYDKTDILSLGEVTVSEGSKIITPNVIDSIINALDTENNAIYLTPGIYAVSAKLINNSNYQKKLICIGETVRIIRS